MFLLFLNILNEYRLDPGLDPHGSGTRKIQSWIRIRIRMDPDPAKYDSNFQIYLNNMGWIWIRKDPELRKLSAGSGSGINHSRSTTLKKTLEKNLLGIKKIYSILYLTVGR